ncbi:MAG: pyruvate kinase [Acidobacteriota bacterium]|nr:pyruvate kinase [Acidobacteriota bacterium]
MNRRAKIVATLGPASADKRVLRRLLKAGVDVVRLNLSHGTHDEHRRNLQRVRRLSTQAGLHIPVILDLMGPRYRLGHLPAPVTLRRGTLVSLGLEGEASDLVVDDRQLIDALKPRDRILVDNGLVELRVEGKANGRVTAKVKTAGKVDSRKGINLPDSDLPFTISAKDEADIRFAVDIDADYLAASYVGAAEDIDALRRSVLAAGGKIPLIAKLERALAVANLEDLIASADAVMVARGDLGVEVPLHKVPILQKRIISAGRRHGKPVIVATQMLESMMERKRPTRAESSDVANAVFDGADALMLSGESAIGRHPVDAVRTMGRIISEAERYARTIDKNEHSVGRLADVDLFAPFEDSDGGGSRTIAFRIADTIAAAAVHATHTLGLRHVVAFSQGGFTARVISRYRPAAPIWMLTTMESVARRVQLAWGVRPLLLDDDVQHHDEVISRVDSELLRHGLAKPGDAIAVLMGDPIRERPMTNLLRLHRIRALKSG